MSYPFQRIMAISKRCELKREKRPNAPVVLVILDGFGTSKQRQGNAVALARMPVLRKLLREYPSTTLCADGEAVGLPAGQVGNSEAGHMTIGAGRPVETDLVRINSEIRQNTFHDNPALLRAAAHATRNHSTLHLMGLLTNRASGHSYPDHVYALLKFAEELHVPNIVVHAFTDGRDTPPYHALKLMSELQKHLPKTAVIGSVCGRSYAMDRNRFWDRTGLAYHALVGCEGLRADDPIEAIEKAYARGESDEFITPTLVCSKRSCAACVKDHDAIVFWNLRSDRARQLTKPFVMPDFERRVPGAFRRKAKRKDLFFVTLTEFGTDLEGVVPAYPNRGLSGTLVEALRSHKQYYIAESEKYVHVTYFFDGGYDGARFGEHRVSIPTTRVERYDEKPQMRAKEIVRRACKALDDGADFICANIANADMVGHTGNLPATVAACEAIDAALGELWKDVQRHCATLVVMSDHGNAESLLLPDGTPDTEHNANPVPFCVAGSFSRPFRLRSGGELADVAPTILTLLGVDIPEQMTGRSLMRKA